MENKNLASYSVENLQMAAQILTEEITVGLSTIIINLFHACKFFHWKHENKLQKENGNI